jgi:hypothetical protein
MSPLAALPASGVPQHGRNVVVIFVPDDLDTHAMKLLVIIVRWNAEHVVDHLLNSSASWILGI